MHFQNYVFTVICAKTLLPLGTYPTFKKAYERIEECHEKDDVIAIVDLGDKGDSAIFEVIRSYKYDFMNDKYIIARDLLSIFPEDKTISYEMVKELKEKNKNSQKKYKTTIDVM